MGSQPWKQATMDRWESAFSGERVVVSNPGRIIRDDDSTMQVERLEGRFSGHGQWCGRPCIWIHLRPEMNVRDPGYFAHEVAVIVKRGMEVHAT
jgi:hypothetical protein